MVTLPSSIPEDQVQDILDWINKKSQEELVQSHEVFFPHLLNEDQLKVVIHTLRSLGHEIDVSVRVILHSQQSSPWMDDGSSSFKSAFTDPMKHGVLWTHFTVSLQSGVTLYHQTCNRITEIVDWLSMRVFGGSSELNSTEDPKKCNWVVTLLSQGISGDPHDGIIPRTYCCHWLLIDLPCSRYPSTFITHPIHPLHPSLQPSTCSLKSHPQDHMVGKRDHFNHPELPIPTLKTHSSPDWGLWVQCEWEDHHDCWRMWTIEGIPGIQWAWCSSSLNLIMEEGSYEQWTCRQGLDHPSGEWEVQPSTDREEGRPRHCRCHWSWVLGVHEGSKVRV